MDQEVKFGKTFLIREIWVLLRTLRKIVEEENPAYTLSLSSREKKFQSFFLHAHSSLWAFYTHLTFSLFHQ
ncbi:hypothetical protein L6452_39013 [Arctium lappa]|uniref:Uncharacterized protein n=1 Tax=Arctium lappa TaxID=4217 RepID=A0ACB8XRR6_ARCLA|nr:hypothetical protein L6452_39013 [Arctium lappa]